MFKKKKGKRLLVLLQGQKMIYKSILIVLQKTGTWEERDLRMRINLIYVTLLYFTYKLL